jgi:hypothetical protein
MSDKPRKESAEILNNGGKITENFVNWLPQGRYA